MSEVTYYGADWCTDCRRSKAQLQGLGVAFEEKNVEQVAEFATEAESISGRKNIPVIVFADGEFLVEPSNPDLEAALAKRGLIG
jgi:mycoredoxin